MKHDLSGIVFLKFAGDGVDSGEAKSADFIGFQQGSVVAANVEYDIARTQAAPLLNPARQFGQVAAHCCIGPRFVAIAVSEQLAALDGVLQLRQSTATTVNEDQRRLRRIRFTWARKPAGERLRPEIHDLVERSTTAGTALT